MEKVTSKSYFTIEKRTNEDAKVNLFSRLSDLSTIRNPEQDKFLNDLYKLEAKYNHIPALSKSFHKDMNPNYI